MSDDIDIPNPQSVTVGSIGPPGARAFYLQVWEPGSLVTFKLEKQQVAALGQALSQLLEDLAVDREALPELPEVIDPGEPEWAVATMGLSAVDAETGRAVLVLHELVPEDHAGRVSEARVGMTLRQLAALAEQCGSSLAGGRPNCELCGRPIDPEGHVCPKTNGHTTH